MKFEQYLEQLKKGSNYLRFNNAISNRELYLALIGKEPYDSNAYEFLKVSPLVVLSLLHIFISEGKLTNTEINEAFRQIEIKSKEDVWLLLLYIEAALLYKKNRVNPLVELDIDYQIKKINEVWEIYKDDFTVKKYVKDIYKITGKRIFGV